MCLKICSAWGTTHFRIPVWPRATSEFGVVLKSNRDEALIIRPSSYVERWDVAALFPRAQPLEVELGAGDGSFLIAWATAHPERNFIGVERLLGRLKKIEKKGRRAALTNLRGARIEIGYFTEYLLPLQSVDVFHIYFPDPWPKLRHRHHRLINEHFARALQAALKPGGIVYLRTDDGDYFTQMRAVFGANAGFVEVPTPDELAQVTTDFERHFNAQGIPTNRAAYQRKA